MAIGLPKNGTRQQKSRLYTTENPPSLEDVKALCSQTLSKHEYPLCSELAEQLADEFHHILNSSSGVLVIKGMYQDISLLERVNTVFQDIIDEERSFAKGDHFGKGGANDRIWNAFTKHGLRDPYSFFEYYSNLWMQLVCSSWLGPMYRVTSQVNIVKPGGAPQLAHRDYHLGFMDADTCQKFPASTHIISQYLTLQGAVAHSTMPLGSGPTRLLPFSQSFEEGYMAYRRPEFSSYFAEEHVSLPLDMGDGLFFNPALFHAAGENRTSSLHRSANLIQASSAFGKSMEAIDTVSLVERSWPVLQDNYNSHGGLSQPIVAFICALAEGYPFPADLDARPPQPNGMAPDSEQNILMKSLQEGLATTEVVAKVKALRSF